MTKRFFLITLPVCVFIALSVAFLFTQPAFAQDEMPPEVVPTEAPAEVLPAEAAPVEEIPTAEAPVDVTAIEEAPVEVLPTEAAPVEELPVEAGPVEEAPTEEPSLAEALDAADVVLAEPSGEAVTLATRSSENLIATGDPYFTVGSITYRFMKPGGCGALSNCWESSTPISAALSYMIDNSLTPTDRKLYIQEDTYNETVYIDGSTPGVKGLLTIEGVSPILGGVVDPEKVIINGNLIVQNFLSGFSIKNLTVNNTTGIDDAAIYAIGNKGTIKLTDVNTRSTGEDGTGIIIFHTGTVELNRVNSNNNNYMGAFIVNFGTGPIKITNSTFENNDRNINDGNPAVDCNEWNEFGDCLSSAINYVGLNIAWSSGPVILDGISASSNIGDGVQISAYYSSVSIKNSVFDDNEYIEIIDPPHHQSWGDGLWIDSNTVNLENVQANNNGMRGIFSYANTSFNALHLHTDNNGWAGIEVNNCFDWDDGDSTCDNPGAGTVTIKTSSAINNTENGFQIYSKGAITLYDVYSSGNDLNGYILANNDAPSPAPITVTMATAQGPTDGDGKPNGDPDNKGFEIYSRGAVTLNSINAYDFASDGVYIENSGTGAVTITGSTEMWNETARNGGNGYTIISKGPVTVSNLNSFDNNMLGGYIKNSDAIGAAPVTVINNAPVGYLNIYERNGGGGLKILSRGAVTVRSLRANDNGGTGLEINNIPPGTAGGVPVTVSDSSFDNNWFGYDGLNIVSKGLITLLNIRANNNGGYGVYLDNKTAGGTAGVTVNAGTGKGNEFQGNRLSGLVIRTNGPAILTNLYSSNNGSTYESLGDFSITTHLLFEPDSNFQFSGLVVFQDMNNFQQLGRAYCDDVDNCTGNGIYFDRITNGSINGDNCDTAIANSSEVYLRLDRVGSNLNAYYSADGSNWVFLGNHLILEGFQINGIGFTASQDFFTPGLRIPSDFDYFGITSPDFIDGFNGSLEDGWVWVNENPGDWSLDENPGYLRIYNSDVGTGYQNLLLRTVGSGYGVDIDAKGAVTIKQVGQWSVENAWAEGNVFSNNHEGGLRIQSNGAATIAFFQARNNGGDGINVDASGGSGAVTVTGTSNFGDNLRENQGNGLDISSKGNITVSKIDASYTGGFGAFLDNQIGSGSVTVTDANFSENPSSGLQVRSAGAITVKNASAQHSSIYGLDLKNTYGSGKPVTLINVNTWENNDTGVKILSNGAVTITDSQSNTNSVNFQDIGYGDQWSDNLNDGQVWFFSGTNVDNVTIKIESDRFNPRVWVTNTSWEEIASETGTDGSVTLNFNLTAPGTNTYLIHVEAADNWNGYGYDLMIYEGAIEPSPYTQYHSLANGFYVDNSGGTGGVTITNSNSRWNSNNSGNDIEIYSKGVVSLTKMELNDSGTGGLLIRNQTATVGTPGVTLTGVNFNLNDGTGASIQTKGPVVVKDAGLSQNWSFGYEIDNSLGLATTPVTFTNVSVDGYGAFEKGGSDQGIYIKSLGAITLTNTFSNGNASDGMYIKTSGAVTFKGVGARDNRGYGAYVITPGAFTINAPTVGSNDFIQNKETGLYVEAGGKITLTKVFSQENGWRDGSDVPESYANGIYLDSLNTMGTMPVMLTEVTTSRNTLSGLWIETLGSVTINKLNTYENVDWGLKLDQNSPDSLKPVSLNKIMANGNGMDGIFMEAWGSITVNGFDSIGNGDSGIVLINDKNRLAGDGITTIYSTGAITLLNTLGRNLSGLNDVGVFLQSNGVVSVTGLETVSNRQDGLVIYNENTEMPGTPAVTLNSIINRFNNWNGVYIESEGVVTINNSWSTSNGSDGFAILTGGNVSFNNSAAIMNGLAGIEVVTNPLATLKLTNSTWFGNVRDDPSHTYRNLMYNCLLNIL